MRGKASQAGRTYLQPPSEQTTNMAAPPSAYKDRHFLAVIGDEVCPGSLKDSRPANFPL